MIKVPNNLFKPLKQDGKEGKIYIYALDASTIGISPKYLSDWARIALYFKTWSAQRQGNNWRISLPTRVINFYLLRESRTKMVTGINDGNILITVTRR